MPGPNVPVLQGDKDKTDGAVPDEAAFYLPPQEVPTGTALTDNPPLLFQPLKMRSITLKNRIIVSPMCQYSADEGKLTDYHFVHLGQFALRGAALAFVEATAVTPEGRISPQDAGIWSDEHIPPLKRIVDFIHSQKGLAGIQLAHSGRKGSTSQPWKGYHVVKREEGGWHDDVRGPDEQRYDEDHAEPKPLTKEEILQIEDAFVRGTERALAAGFDTVEIHGAHGYLIHNFVSPLSNNRTDEYGGSFENRIRFPLQIAKKIRAVWPEDKPIFYRISATDYVEGGWDVEQSIELSKRLKEVGVDVIDVSSGGNVPYNDYKAGPGYQVPFAAEIKKSLPDMIVTAVGIITNGQQAEEILKKGEADAIMVAREFLRDPNFVLAAARDLGIQAQWPNQYHRAVPAFYKHPEPALFQKAPKMGDT